MHQHHGAMTELRTLYHITKEELGALAKGEKEQMKGNISCGLLSYVLFS